MKIPIVHCALILLAAGGWGCTGAAALEPPAGAQTPAKVAKEGIEIPTEIQKRLGLEISPVVAATLSPEVLASGTVLDPAPLVLLDTELQDAEAAVALSESQVGRARELFGAEQTVSRKTLEQVEHQLRLDTTRRETAVRRLQLEWGDAGALTTEDRRQLVEELLKHDTALLRVEAPAGSLISGTPISARVQLIGRADWTPSAVLGRAPNVDLRSQGQAFLLRVRPAPEAFRAGAALEARLQTPGPANKGWRVPKGAVLRHLGRSWIYLQMDEERFERREVELIPAGSDFWFTATVLPESSRCVTTGAAILLSAELQAAFGPSQGD